METRNLIEPQPIGVHEKGEKVEQSTAGKSLFATTVDWLIGVEKLPGHTFAYLLFFLFIL